MKLLRRSLAAPLYLLVGWTAPWNRVDRWAFRLIWAIKNGTPNGRIT